MQRFSKKQTHMLTSPPSLLAWRLGSIHLGHCLLLKDLLCSHSQLRGEDGGGGRQAADLKGEGGLCYRTGVCSKGEIKGRKINTASRIFTPARVASGRGGVRVCMCWRVCLLQIRAAQWKDVITQARVLGGQASQGELRLAPEFTHGVRQRPGVRTGALSQDPLVRAGRVGTRLGRSAPNWGLGPWGRGGLRSVTREGWTRAWNLGAHLSGRGPRSREGGLGEAQGTGRG